MENIFVQVLLFFVNRIQFGYDILHLLDNVGVCIRIYVMGIKVIFYFLPCRINFRLIDNSLDIPGIGRNQGNDDLIFRYRRCFIRHIVDVVPAIRISIEFFGPVRTHFSKDTDFPCEKAFIQRRIIDNAYDRSLTVRRPCFYVMDNSVHTRMFQGRKLFYIIDFCQLAIA